MNVRRHYYSTQESREVCRLGWCKKNNGKAVQRGVYFRSALRCSFRRRRRRYPVATCVGKRFPKATRVESLSEGILLSDHAHRVFGNLCASHTQWSTSKTLRLLSRGQVISLLCEMLSSLGDVLPLETGTRSCHLCVGRWGVYFRLDEWLFGRGWVGSNCGTVPEQNLSSALMRLVMLTWMTEWWQTE